MRRTDPSPYDELERGRAASRRASPCSSSLNLHGPSGSTCGPRCRLRHDGDTTVGWEAGWHRIGALRHVGERRLSDASVPCDVGPPSACPTAPAPLPPPRIG